MTWVTLGRRCMLLCLTTVAPEGRRAFAEDVPTSLQTDEDAWRAFEDRFVSSEGRIVDTGNGGVSHTEGQGWGLLFAATWGEEATFERILGWTDRNLARPHDALHAWRYVPGGGPAVPDGNNATDGDLFIAWALVRAAARWRRPRFLDQATSIARSILSLLVVDVGGRSLLLPGADGFRKADGVVVNPSYYTFAALQAMAALVPDPRWAAVRRDGLDLLDRARFGTWALPCDWVWAGADGTVRPAPGFPPRYGFDAVRIPLHLAWAGLQSPARSSAAAWWRRAGQAGPAWVDVVTGEVAPYPANPGMTAAEDLGAGTPGFVPPAVADGMDYYGAALVLLTRLALHDLTADRTAAGRR